MAYVYASIIKVIGNRKEQFIFILKMSSPFIFIIVAYLVSYFVFRMNFPPAYLGVSELSLPTVNQLISVISIFSTSGVVFSLEIPIFHKETYIYIWVVLLIVGSYFYAKKDRQLRSNINVGKLILICLIFTVLPNIIFAFAERYREWVLTDSFYLGSYYASFPISLALTLFMSSLVNKSSMYFNLCLLASVLLLFNSASKNHFESIQFFEISKINSDRWSFIRRLSSDIKARNVTIEEDIICTNALITANDAYDYWSYKLQKYSNRNIRVVYNRMATDCKYAIVRNDNNELIFAVYGIEIYK